MEPLVFGFIESLWKDKIYVKHKDTKIDVDSKNYELVIILWEHLTPTSFTKASLLNSYSHGDTISITQTTEGFESLTKLLEHECI